MSEKNKVALGARVDLELVAARGHIEPLTVVLTPDSEADLSAGLVGINTPLAQEAAANRQAILQNAISKSDQANAISFALTVENKWGDYDPEGIAENWE